MYPSHRLIDTPDVSPAPRPGLLHRCASALRSGVRLAARRDGSALVEMGVSLPVIFLVMTGIFSFSNTISSKLSLEQGIGVAGRQLAVDRGDTDPCKTVSATLASAAPKLNSANITYSFTLNGVTTNGKSCPGTGGLANANLVAGMNASITATYPCTLAVYGKTWSSCTLTGKITEVVQ